MPDAGDPHICDAVCEVARRNGRFVFPVAERLSVTLSAELQPLVFATFDCYHEHPRAEHPEPITRERIDLQLRDLKGQEAWEREVRRRDAETRQRSSG